MLSKGTSSKMSYRRGIVELISSREAGFELAVTLNFNRTRSFISAKGKLGEWAQRVDNFYLGRQWMNVPSDRRLFFIAFCENPRIEYSLSPDFAPATYSVAASETGEIHGVPKTQVA